MNQNPEIPAQDQTKTNEKEQSKINSYIFKIEQIDSLIADRIQIKHYHQSTPQTQVDVDKKIQDMNNQCSNSDFKNWNAKVTTMMIDMLNGLELIIDGSKDLSKAQKYFDEILKKE